MQTRPPFGRPREIARQRCAQRATATQRCVATRTASAVWRSRPTSRRREWRQRRGPGCCGDCRTALFAAPALEAQAPRQRGRLPSPTLNSPRGRREDPHRRLASVRCRAVRDASARPNVRRFIPILACLHPDFYISMSKSLCVYSSVDILLGCMISLCTYMSVWHT